MKKAPIVSRVLILFLASILMAPNVRAAEVILSGSCGTTDTRYGTKDVSDNITYVLDSEGLLAFSGSGLMHNYQESGEYGPPWRDQHAGDVKSVSVADGIKYIGSHALSYCDISEITLPGSVSTIREFAFDHCVYLRQVTYDKTNVSMFYRGAFRDCQSLEIFEFPSIVYWIKESAFEGCTSLKTLRFTGGLGSIGDSAFAGCTGLESISFLPVLHEGDTQAIGTNAFYGCTALGSILLPESVKEVGISAFGGCIGLESAEITAGRVGFAAFVGCTGLKTVRLGAGVTEIGEMAFQNCPALADVWYDGTQEQWDALPGSFYMLGVEDTVHAVRVHFSDETVVLSGSCGTAEDGANLSFTLDNAGLLSVMGEGGMADFTKGHAPWQGHENEIRRIYLAEGVTGIGANAFAGCAVSEIAIPSGVTAIGEGAFSGCRELKTVYVPMRNAVVIGKTAFAGCTELEAVPFLQGCSMKVGEDAFRGCTGLRELRVPASVQEIGPGAFADCTGLVRVIFLPEHDGAQRTLGENVFRGCTALEAIQLTRDIVSVPGGAFRGCSGLRAALISAETVESGAFDGCTRLTVLAFSDALQSVAEDAFTGCAISEVSYTGAKEQYDAVPGHFYPDENEASLHFGMTAAVFVPNGGYGMTEVIFDIPGNETCLPYCPFSPPNAQRFSAWTTDDAEYMTGDYAGIGDGLILRAEWEEDALAFTAVRAEDGSFLCSFAPQVLAGSGYCVEASYAPDGIPLQIKAKHIDDLGEGAAWTAEVTLQPGGTFRVFLLDEEFAPLCPMLMRET